MTSNRSAPRLSVSRTGPAFAFAYMLLLAWMGAFVTYRVASAVA